MENNFGKGQDAKEKENLFKCLPEKGVASDCIGKNQYSYVDVASTF
ncbi:MAG: hypothetical protein ACLUVG_05280 [Phocaeicola vulgatus]